MIARLPDKLIMFRIPIIFYCVWCSAVTVFPIVTC